VQAALVFKNVLNSLLKSCIPLC